MTLATPQRSAKVQFDKQAGEYNSQWNEWSKATLSWLLDHSDLKSGDIILDVATGTGFTALAYAERAAKVYAVDVSDGMLGEARARAAQQNVTNIDFSVAPAESLPFPDAQFDIVACRIAAHHFLDVQAFLSEAFRTLKLGGRLMIVDTTVPDDDSNAAAWQNAVEALRDPSHMRNYSAHEWLGMLTDNGFDVRECSTAGEGITIPLQDWMRKAGCSPDQQAQVRTAFADATESARSAFKIVDDTPIASAHFTWQRVVIRADKPAGATTKV